VLLRQAARLTSQRLRTLDALHVATAVHVEPDEVVVYDLRLAEAFDAEGSSVLSPGA